MKFYEQVRAMVNEVPSLTVRDVATMTGKSESYIHNIGLNNQIRFAPTYLKRHKGDIRIHARANGTPLAIIPATALRAANLEKEEKLNFEVVNGTIVFSRVYDPVIKQY